MTNDDAEYAFNPKTVKKVLKEHHLDNPDALVEEAKHHDANEDKFLNHDELSTAAEAIISGETADLDEASEETTEQFASDPNEDSGMTLGDHMDSTNEG